MKIRNHIFAIIIVCSLLLLSACQNNDGAFGPIRPTPTLIGLINQQSVPVNFETLNSDPSIFVDRFIEASGQYIPLREASCSRSRGPSIDWFLVSDGLEMNMSGHGSIVDILPDQQFVTVEGIWRRYEGPVGCAKEPQSEVVWYLEIVRIIDPNPIVASAGNSRGNVGTVPTASVSEPDNGGGDSSQESTPTPITTNEPEVTPTASATPLQNNTTPESLTPIATETPTRAIAQPTSAPPTATATETPADNGDNQDQPTFTPTSSAAEPTETVEPTPTSNGLGGTGEGTPDPSTPVPAYPGPAYPSPTP